MPSVSVEACSLLRSFGVSPRTGFLMEQPARRLPSAYDEWHRLADEIMTLIEKDLLTERVLQLPVLDTSTLEGDVALLRLAHLLLATAVAGFLWQHGPEKAPLRLPRSLAIPFRAVSAALGMQPIASHVTTCLANWKWREDGERPKQNGDASSSPEVPVEDIDLIAFRFLPSGGDVWFYTLTAEIEAHFGVALSAVTEYCLRAEEEEEEREEGELIRCVEVIGESLRRATASIKRMPERMTPREFYHGIRTMLFGYDVGALSQTGGLLFEGVDGDELIQLPGATAAQSPSLAAVDTFLAISHKGESGEYLTAQRAFMFRGHRDYLEWLAARAPSKERLLGEAKQAYNSALEELRAFRSAHINTVALFIIAQASSAGQKAQGTGGSSLMQFLKSVRADCEAGEEKSHASNGNA